MFLTKNQQQRHSYQPTTSTWNFYILKTVMKMAILDIIDAQVLAQFNQ